MLVLRLSRHGRKNYPTYRLVLQEKDWSPTSKVLETLGHMNPHTHPTTVSLKKDRIEYWLNHGAQASSTVHNMLITAGMVAGKKRRVVFGKKKASKQG